jgi:biotin operon repressor
MTPLEIVDCGANPPARPREDVLYVTPRLSVRDALIAHGARAVFVHHASERTPEQVRAAVAFVGGTVYPGSRQVDLADGSTRLSPAQAGLVQRLADGAWHPDLELQDVIRGTPRALHSAMARLRRRLGGGIERATNFGWRLVGVTRPEGRIEALLDDERPVPAADLARALGCSVPALRARIHRLRRQGVAIRTEAGGYLLGAPPADVWDDVEAALLSAGLVYLQGDAGVGKSEQIRRAAPGTPVVDVHGLAIDRVRRRLDRLPAGRRVVVDGIVDAGLLREALNALATKVEQVVIGCRVGALGTVVPMPDPARPWVEDLAPVDVGRRWFDSLPGPDRTALLAAVIDGGPASAWTSLGFPTGPDGHLAAGFRRGAWTLLDDETLDAVVARVLEAVRGRLDRADPLAPPGAETLAEELLDELRRRERPHGALTALLFQASVRRDPTLTLEALDRPAPPATKALLHYQAWLLGVGEAHLDAAIATGDRWQQAEFRIERAYRLQDEDPVAAAAVFAATRVDVQDPSAPPSLRTDWLSARALSDPGSVDPAVLLAHLGHVDRLWLELADPQARWMGVMTLWALGCTRLARDEVPQAVVTLQRLVQTIGPEQALRRGALDLLHAYVRAERMAEARMLWQTVRTPALPPRWEANRRIVRGLWLLAEGQDLAAREQTVPAELPARFQLLRRLLDVLDGRPDPATGIAEDPLLATLADVVAGRSALEALRALPATRRLSGALLERIVAYRV